VAVAVYVVVAVGESVTLPAGSELVVSVRVEEPVLAVMVTDVEKTACQFNVTLSPTLMELALAENCRAGGFELPLKPVQPQHVKRATNIAPQGIQRNNFVFIFLFVCALPKACPIQMPLCAL
jgi:hypothetical protein